MQELEATRQSTGRAQYSSLHLSECIICKQPSQTRETKIQTFYIIINHFITIYCYSFIPFDSTFIALLDLQGTSLRGQTFPGQLHFLVTASIYTRHTMESNLKVNKDTQCKSASQSAAQIQAAWTFLALLLLSLPF